MKQYYIFIGKEQVGPLSFEELKEKNITNETMVCFEGQIDWKKAYEIEELKELLRTVPPPINAFAQSPPLPKNETKKIDDNDDTPKILGLRKNLFFIITGVVIISIIGLNYYQDYNKQKLEEINQTTEAHNQQLELQQKEIDEQQARIAEQEQIEIQRKEKEKRQALERRYNEINNDLTLLYDELSQAKKHLNDVTAFKLLRTSSERNEQINTAQYNIDVIKDQIRNLEEEMKKINTIINK